MVCIYGSVALMGKLTDLTAKNKIKCLARQLALRSTLCQRAAGTNLARCRRSRVEQALAEVPYKGGYGSDVVKPQLLTHTATYT